MGRLAATFGALLALLLVPLALNGTTAWALLPAHLVLTGLGVAACLGEAWAGRPVWVRVWGVGYVAATVAMVVALELGTTARDATFLYWLVPWTAAMAWGWTVPAAALFGEVVGQVRRRRLSRRAVIRRKRGAR